MITRGRAGLLPAFLAVLAACTSDLSPVQPVLEPASIKIADSAPQELRIEAPADAPVLITLSTRDVDIKATILRTDQSALLYADAPNRRMGIETLLVEPPHAGVMTLRIERNDHGQASGTVQIRAVVLPTVTPDDRKRLEAARLEAIACLSFPDPARGNASAEAFAAAAQLHEENGDRRQAGTALLHAAGVRYTRAADWQGAAHLSAQALHHLERAGAAELAAFALRVQGAALGQLANASGLAVTSRNRISSRARKQLTESAGRFRSLGLPYEAGYALNYRGVSFLDAGERASASADFRQALEMFRTAKDRPAQALSLQSLALLSHDDGRLGDAMREFDEAIALIPRDEEPENYAHTLHNSALPLRVLGRFDEAIARYFEAGAILRELGDRDGEARALHGLGTTMLYAGEPERAAELLRAAIALRGETGARRERANSLFVLGQIERDGGAFDSAINLHRQARTLVDAPHDLAQAHLALARDYLAAASLPAARRELDLILQLNLPTSHRYLGLALTELGTLASREGRHQEAYDALARAIAIHKANGSDLELARALHRRADAKLRAGDTQAVLDDTAVALQILDAIGLQGTRVESRASFRASYRDVVELRIAALLRDAESMHKQGDPVEEQRLLQSALTASDRTRAQSVVEAWAAAPAGAEVPAELLARRKAAYELLAGKRQLQERLLETARPDEKRLGELAREIALLRTEANLIEERVAKSRDAARAPTAVTITGLANAVPPNVVVAEYFLGNAQSWLFTTSRGVVAVHSLPDKATLEALARRIHLEWRSAARSPDDRLATARDLATKLFRPLGTATPAGGLQIIPDGALHLVPMTLLALQAWPELRPGMIVTAPSLSALQAAGLARRPAADRTLAIIADPIYSEGDSRIDAGFRRIASSEAVPLTRVARDPASLQRLPSASAEARALIDLVNDPADMLALIGPDADRQRVLNSPLSRFRILHFATHAMADSQDPALATLALSRWNASGEPADGDLRLYDITQMQLNADLVVLSACDTALGREIAGEGPIGLSQAFLRSGARSVLASLWQVPDSSTAFLMREFYRHYLTKGQTAAVALQLAQNSVRRRAKWSDPYYWAGFQLVSILPMSGGVNDVERREE